MDRKELKKHITVGLIAFAVIAGGLIMTFLLLHGKTVLKFLDKFIGILTPFIYGGALAYLTAPLYNAVVRFMEERYEKEKKPVPRRVHGFARFLASTACIASVLIAVGGLLMLIIPQLVISIRNIQSSLPQYLQQFYDSIRSLLREYPDMEAAIIQNVQNLVASLESWWDSFIKDFNFTSIASIWNGVSTSVRVVAGAIGNWILGAIIMVYLLNMKSRLKAQAKALIYSLMSLKTANAVIEEFRLVNQIFGGFILGKLMDSLIIGIICFIGVSLMNMPFPVLLAAIIGVTNVLPYFGPFIGAIPTTVLILLVDPIKALYFVLFILVLQQFDGNILGPRILGNSTGLSSFWVLFSILMFGGFFGFVGMIIAVPAFAVIYDLVGRGIGAALKKKKLPRQMSLYENLDHIDESTGKLVHSKEKDPSSL